MTGPYVGPFGDVISSALNLESSDDINFPTLRNFGLLVGQVVKMYTLADKEAIQGTEPEQKFYTAYDVAVMSGEKNTIILKNCRLMQPTFGGGINNFLEVIQTNPKYEELGKKAQKFEDLQAHYVIVGFVAGSLEAPVILGTMPHPNKVSQKVREKLKPEEVHTEGEIQGLNFKIDKEGAFTLTFQGPKEEDPKKDGKHKREEFKGKEKDQKSGLKDKSKQESFPGTDAPTVLNIDKDGNITVTNNQKQRIRIDRQKKVIRIDNDQTYINMEQGDDGHAKVSIVANNIEIGHQDKDTTQAYKPGGGQKLQPIIMGDDFQYFMEQLIEEICKIVHPTGVGPSGTPVNKPQFQQLKAKLPELLSKKHKVEK